MNNTKWSNLNWWQKIVGITILVGIPLVIFLAVFFVMIVIVKIAWSLC